MVVSALEDMSDYVNCVPLPVLSVRETSIYTCFLYHETKFVQTYNIIQIEK